MNKRINKFFGKIKMWEKIIFLGRGKNVEKNEPENRRTNNINSGLCLWGPGNG
jgi:hypothetical protein